MKPQDPTVSAIMQRFVAAHATQQSVSEERFYKNAPRFEDQIRRVCGRSVVMLRSEIAESLVRGLQDLEGDYRAARTEAGELGHSGAEIEARFGAAVVVIHLQLISKIDELDQLAATATPVADVKRLAENLGTCTTLLADIETRCSIATTGDLNEEERNKVRGYGIDRFVHVAEAVQLRKEAIAAKKRLSESHETLAQGPQIFNHEQTQQAEQLKLKAEARLTEIRARADHLGKVGDVRGVVALDQALKRVYELLNS